jgi:hypothetical protein
MLYISLAWTMIFILVLLVILAFRVHFLSERESDEVELDFWWKEHPDAED